MTSLAFVLGMLPMVLATGPGSASRHSIGTGIFFGMIVAITVGIVLVPFFFVQIYKVHKVHKVYKVTGVLRTAFNGSPSCRQQSAPQGSINLINFINLMNFTNFINPKISQS